MASKRLKKELKTYNDNPLPNTTFKQINNNDIYKYQASIMGPPNSPYEGGIYYLDIHFPTDYPFKPPECKFSNKIYHPNINQNGYIPCEFTRILSYDWNPSLNIFNILELFISILANPNEKRFIDVELRNLYKENRYQYYKNAHEFAVKYAGAPEKNSFLENLRIKILNNFENENELVKETIKKEIDYELNCEKAKNLKLTEEINILKSKIKEQEILLNNKKINITEDKQNLLLDSNKNNLNPNDLFHQLQLKENELIELKSLLPFPIYRGEKLMTIIFKSSDQTIQYSCICKNTDLFNRLENELKNEYPEYMKDNNYYFLCNGAMVERDKTLEENHIKTNNIILINKLLADSKLII